MICYIDRSTYDKGVLVMNTGAADAVREMLTKDPNLSPTDVASALPQFAKNTVRTLVSRYRSTGSTSGFKPKQEYENALIADHLAGKITAEELSKALHLRGDVEKQRAAFIDVMIRANKMVSLLTNTITEEGLNTANDERIAIITLLGGTLSDASPTIPSIPQVPVAA